MKLNIVVCGKFHYGNYLRFLIERAPTLSVYFSHKQSTELGIPAENRINLFAKEYVVQGLPRLLGPSFREVAIKLGHAVWRWQLRKNFVPRPINLIMLHGNCKSAIDAAKAAGCIVIGEVVNAHPETVDDRLRSEGRLTGAPVTYTRNAEEIIAEAHAVDFLLCPSVAVAESFVKHGVPISKVRVIAFGFSDIRYERGSNSQQPARAIDRVNPINIICVAEVSLRKGQHLLLKALNAAGWLIDGRPCKLHLVGAADEKYLAYLRLLSNNFSHTPHISHDEVLREIQVSDCLVLTSLEDGFGMVVGEALSQGTPVVVSRYAGSSEIARGCAGAHVVDPFNIDEILNGISAATCVGASRISPDRLRSWRDYANELYEFMCEVSATEEKDIVGMDDCRI